MRPQAPCSTCERRGCGAYHDQCELYSQYRQTMDHYNMEHRREIDSHSYSNSHIADRNAFYKVKNRIPARRKYAE